MNITCCEDCGDVILIVVDPDSLDPEELATKTAAHAEKHAELEAML